MGLHHRVWELFLLIDVVERHAVPDITSALIIDDYELCSHCKYLLTDLQRVPLALTKSVFAELFHVSQSQELLDSLL